MRRRWGLSLSGALVLAFLAMIYLMPSLRQTRSARHPQAIAQVRGLVAGLMSYAQSHSGEFPPPDRSAAVLVPPGIVPQEFFEPPARAPGEPAYFAIVPPPATGKWSASFTPAVPLVYANPAFFDGGRTAVGYSDGHVELVAVADLDSMVKASGGRAEPVR